MKKNLLTSTALVGTAALFGGVAGAAEAPTWKLTGNANFQFYWVDQDETLVTKRTITGGGSVTVFKTKTLPQDHDWYFGVDEAELQLNVSGTADNGLNYGFKIELNANTTDDTMADEVRLQFSGGWGTLQMGDEDGAEDIMNYGGENLMGATGGFDGDQDDYLFRVITTKRDSVAPTTFLWLAWGTSNTRGAPMYPTIAGDTSDQTKISYFSPRFSGFQVGASLTPTPNNGDDFKEDGDWENHIGIGANYDNSFGGVRVRASAVYSAASQTGTGTEDISAWSVGGIVGFGPFSLGANYTDNGESGMPTASGWESSYWNVAASFETGPLYISAGYFDSTMDYRDLDLGYSHIALTADYTVAPGLGVYAEINFIEDDWDLLSHETTSLVAGANVSF